MKYKNMIIIFMTGLANRPGYDEKIEITKKSVSYLKEYNFDIYKKAYANGVYDKIEWKFDFDKKSECLQLIEKLYDLIVDFDYDRTRNTHSEDTDILTFYVKSEPKGVINKQIWQPIRNMKAMRDLDEIKNAIKKLIPNGQPMPTWFN